jgi:hypothetical protein
MRGQEKAETESGDRKAEEEHLKAKKSKVIIITTQDIVAITTISPPIDTANPMETLTPTWRTT